MKNLLVAKIAVMILIIVVVIALGGVYAGRMIGLMIIAFALIASYTFKDTKKYKTGKMTWLGAMGKSAVENIKYFIK